MKNNHLLYKFREIDKFAIDILVNKRLYLSSWTTLNDPHEAEMYIETEHYNIQANPRRLQSLDERYFHKGFIDEDIINPKINTVKDINKKLINRFINSSFCDSNSTNLTLNSASGKVVLNCSIDCA